MTFTQKDLEYIKNKGLTIEQVEKQIALFKSGIPFTKIVEAATVNNGILRLNNKQTEDAISYFESSKDKLSLLKFVPASGAASRMFKFLFEFLTDYKPNETSLSAFIKQNNSKDITRFMEGLEKFPFYNLVLQQLEVKKIHYSKLSDGEKVWHFVDTMLDETQLNFGDQPKGLLPFHEYNDNTVFTAFEEHLHEGALYASSNNKAKLHFTISEQHDASFHKEFESVKDKVEKQTGITFEVSFSYQQESTDTIAVTPEDEPFRNDNGTLLFRPSGHGALLKNLNALESDVIFIKNIDNVVISQYRAEIAKYKKMLAGILIKVQKESFKHLNTLDHSEITDQSISEIAKFLTQDLKGKISEEFITFSTEKKANYLHEQLNRPIRICGMVKNEGEPGGGPFWIMDEYGKQSLQIVESAQVDLDNDAQDSILKNSTHFNPVDLVCSTKNYKGEPFDLDQYVNHNAAFITQKTKLGKPLKALELPGLWNGSMAYWNTIFVEVPIITFNPVKTVNDLLKPTHQSH